MKHKTDNQDHQNDLPDAVVSDVDDSRRKFNKAGLIAPVMLSLSSKPVWAFDCTPSTLASGNLSNECTPPLHGFTAVELINADVWPSPLTKAALFDTIFGKTPTGSFSLFGDSATLISVLDGTSASGLSNSNLRSAFNCTAGTNNLKAALTAYAKQSIVSALNDLYFPLYAYAGTSTFYSAISGSSDTCDNRANSITTVTSALAALTTS